MNQNSIIEREKDFKFDGKIMSSSHINFLFGAGVNGNAFPQLKGFTKTISKIGKEACDEYGFELALNKINCDSERDLIKETFISEFIEFEKKIEFENDSLINLSELLVMMNKLIEQSENRTISTKQINIYTLNYDKIVEKLLSDKGFLSNTISSSNINLNDKFFNLVGYNHELRRYVPTFLISKLHGDIDDPILPGKSKFDDIIMAKRFEILFKMKQNLSRDNSILIVIGYSGKDEHINRILKDCIHNGLTIYWFRFSSEEQIPEAFLKTVTVIDNPSNIDTTKVCSDFLGELWNE